MTIRILKSLSAVPVSIVFSLGMLGIIAMIAVAMPFICAYDCWTKQSWGWEMLKALIEGHIK
jgi:hypothetical protein